MEGRTDLLAVRDSFLKKGCSLLEVLFFEFEHGSRNEENGAGGGHLHQHQRAVSSANGGTGNTATAVLTVGAPVPTAPGPTTTTTTAPAPVPPFPHANVSYPNGAIVTFGGAHYVFAGGRAFAASASELAAVQKVDPAQVLAAPAGASAPTAVAPARG